MANEIQTRQPSHTFADLERMAIAVAKSGLFGVKTPEAALTLMMIANEEGTGVAAACRDFHVIEGRPALKVDAMLARFQKSGGKVEWHEMSDQKCEATFSHLGSSPLKLAWTWDMAVKAKLHTKDNWVKYPRAMLRSRVVSEGIRAVAPGAIVGIYEVNEIRDGADEIDPASVVSVQETVDTETGEIKVPAGAEQVATPEGDRGPASDPGPFMDENDVLDHLTTINDATTLAELKTAHAKAYAAASKAQDSKALMRFEVAKNGAKYKLTKGGAT